VPLINVQTFCGNAAEAYGWSPEKVDRLVRFLIRKSLYRQSVPQAELHAALAEFGKEEPAGEAAPDGAARRAS
jgi:hypothetical protein